MAKKIIKWAVILITLLIASVLIAMMVVSRPLPKGQLGQKAEQLADEVLESIHHKQLAATEWVSWSFPGDHQYVWHVPSHYAQISYDDVVVKMELQSQQGSATRSGVSLQDEALNKALDKAWSLWCNDSWWLIAPHKIRDKGTSRSYVDVSDRYPGMRGLMVSYDSGGVTPGDSYLWIVDSTGLPIGYEMWVDIIPIGGLYATWEKYQDLHSGAKVATQHDLGVVTLGLGPLTSGSTYREVGLKEDIFSALR